MNVNDVDNDDIPLITPEQWLEAIFERQTYLHNKYKDIEYKSGIGLALIQNVPFNINDKRCQYVIKDFAWRVTEELAEASEAHKLGHREHYLEEIIDALHFFTEMLILLCKDHTFCNARMPHDFPKIALPDTYMFSVVEQIGLAMNCLKQKPWKQHHFPTDEGLFHLHLKIGYVTLVGLLRNEGLSKMDIYQVYYKKSEVNKFRQRSNY